MQLIKVIRTHEQMGRLVADRGTGRNPDLCDAPITQRLDVEPRDLLCLLEQLIGIDRIESVSIDTVTTLTDIRLSCKDVIRHQVRRLGHRSIVCSTCLVHIACMEREVRDGIPYYGNPFRLRPIERFLFIHSLDLLLDIVAYPLTHFFRPILFMADAGMHAWCRCLTHDDVYALQTFRHQQLMHLLFDFDRG